jgi:hypothetical protein
MHHQNRDRADPADGLPAFLARVPVGARERERIVENELCRVKTQTVLAPVLAVLLRVPRPRRATLRL